jgi:hypothetical protein
LMKLRRSTSSSLATYVTVSTVFQSCKQSLRESSVEFDVQALIAEIWTRTLTLTTSRHYLNMSTAA